MRIILYCAADAPFIEAALSLLSHINQCPRCRHHAHTDGEVTISDLFGSLNSITTDDILTHDYEAAIAFCHVWLDRHETLSGIDTLFAEPIHDRPN